MTIKSVAAAIKKAGSTETEALVSAFKGLELASPVGNIKYREQDNQSTMGAYVGKIGLKDGSGVVVDWSYKNGGDYTLSDEEVKSLRPTSN